MTQVLAGEGISSAQTLQAPILTFGRIATAIATNSAARYRHLAARPITRHMSLALVARHPRLLKADLAYEGFIKGAGKPGFDGALRACLNYDFRDRLPDVKVPTLIVWGERDSIIPAAHGAAAHEAMPGSRFEVFEGAGHMPHDDDPFRFAALLTDFCETTDGARLEHDHWQPLLGDTS